LIKYGVSGSSGRQTYLGSSSKYFSKGKSSSIFKNI